LSLNRGINSKCIEVFRGSTLVLRENKSKIEINNAKGVQKVTVDGCAITDGIRCDYMVIIPGTVEIYIELKGHNVCHAVEQIKRTIEILSIDKFNFPKKSYIICSRFPRQTTDIQNLQKHFWTKYKSKLSFESILCRITL